MTGWTPRRLLIAAAVAGGALAPLAGSPYRHAAGPGDIRRLAAEVAHEDDHVTAMDLAGWIHDRRPGLHVIDVRDAGAFNAFHLPGAEHVPLTSIATTRIPVTDTVVIYSDGGAHAAQAWVFMRALGFTHVYFLRGGVNEWLDAAAEATTSAAASAAPRSNGGARPVAKSVARSAPRRSRYGC